MHHIEMVSDQKIVTVITVILLCLLFTQRRNILNTMFENVHKYFYCIVK